LNIEVKFLLSANRKSYTCMSRRLAQQRMTLSDLEWPFHVSRAIYAAAELLVLYVKCIGWRLLLHSIVAFCTANRVGVLIP